MSFAHWQEMGGRWYDRPFVWLILPLIFAGIVGLWALCLLQETLAEWR